MIKKLLFFSLFVPAAIVGAGIEAGKESLKERCDLCERPKCDKGSGLLCEEHYSKVSNPNNKE